MFGKRKKEREAQELVDNRIEAQKKFDESIQSASAIKDPAERILALRNVGQQIVDQIDSEDIAINKTVAKTEKKARAFGVFPAAAGGFAVASLVAGPLGWAGVGIVYAGIALGEIFASKSGKAVKKKLQENAKDYIQNLNEKADLVGVIISRTVEDNVQQISKSPLYPEVIDIPGLPEVFASVAAKHITEEKEKAAKAAADAEKKKAAATPRKKQAPNYNELKGL
jgi:hypothetical protein